MAGGQYGHCRPYAVNMLSSDDVGWWAALSLRDDSYSVPMKRMPSSRPLVLLASICDHVEAPGLPSAHWENFAVQEDPSQCLTRIMARIRS